MESKITQEQLEQIKIMRAMSADDFPTEDGTLEHAKMLAEKFTKDYGIKAMVIRKKNKYFWVTPHYFKTYKYYGKIYFKTKVDEA